MAYRLIVALCMLLTIVSIVVGWQKYYSLSLAGITFLLLLGNHLSYMLARWKSLFFSCWRKIVKSYQDIVKNFADSLCRKINRWENCDISNSPLLLLSPEIDNKAHKEYVGRLKAAIDNPDVHNVALMGSYGSGKSSILKTFKDCYPKYKSVDVSLASFSKCETANGNGDSKEDGVDKLEYCILQQLFYHVRLSDIPESRFGRIERLGVLSRIVLTGSILLLAISSLCLVQPKWLTDNFPVVKELLNNVNTKYIALVILLLGFTFIVSFLVRFFKRLGLKNFGISMSAATLEIEDRKNTSVMNRYLDEIIYLFQKKKYEVVFFEDLDRFGTIDIFTKLRELNIILNQSEDVKRRIVFVYAMCDNLFASPEDRTKFFDYIIPVIPYANVSNSADLFKRKFKSLEISEEGLSTEFLTDISHFVTDTRVLKNIINEFMLYHKVLDSKLNLEHLLAIILYKNLYSEDFSLLHQGKGMLYEVFASVPQLKAKMRERIQKRMMDIDAEIKEIYDEELNDITELKSIVIANFMKFLSDSDRYPVDENGHSVNVEKMYDDNIIDMMLKGNMGFRDSYTNRNRYVRKDEIIAALGNNFDYGKRKKLIENKKSGEVDKLGKERHQLEKQLAYIEDLLLHKLVSNISDVFMYVNSYHNLPEENRNYYNVLGYLLKEGYIDEDYFYYISIFQEGRMTPQDNQFLLSVKFDEPKGYAFGLTAIETIISNLRNKDYNKAAIINFDLLQFLLKNEEQYSNQCDAFINTLWRLQNLDFVFSYISNRNCVEVFVKRLAHCYVSIWGDICEDGKFTRQDKMNFLKLLFAHAEIDAIKNINERSPFSEFLNQDDDWQNAFESCDENKALNVLDTINLKIANLKDGDSDQAKVLVEHVCEAGMYQLNFNNLKFVAILNGLEFNVQDASVYLQIMNSNLEQLKKFIKDNINEFAENVIKEQNTNFVSEEEIVELLKEDHVEFETKIDLIYKKKFKVNDSTAINTDLLPFLVETEKMRATINNVMDYYGINGNKFTPDLIEFMNKHISELCEDVKRKTKLEKDYEDFLPAIISESQINKTLSFAIFENEFIKDSWISHINELDDNQLFYVLNKKIIPADNMNSQVADRFLNYFMKPHSDFDYTLFVKALELSNNDCLKALANAKCIEKRRLQLTNIPAILTAMGNSFEKLKHVGDQVKIPAGDGVKEFLDALHSIKYLGRITQQGKEFSVKVRKTR